MLFADWNVGGALRAAIPREVSQEGRRPEDASHTRTLSSRPFLRRTLNYWFNSWQKLHETEARFALWQSIHAFIEVSCSFHNTSRVATGP